MENTHKRLLKVKLLATRHLLIMKLFDLYLKIFNSNAESAKKIVTIQNKKIVESSALQKLYEKICLLSIKDEPFRLRM